MRRGLPGGGLLLRGDGVEVEIQLDQLGAPPRGAPAPAGPPARPRGKRTPPARGAGGRGGGGGLMKTGRGGGGGGAPRHSAYTRIATVLMTIAPTMRYRSTMPA